MTLGDQISKILHLANALNKLETFILFYCYETFFTSLLQFIIMPRTWPLKLEHGVWNAIEVVFLELHNYCIHEFGQSLIISIPICTCP